ncbi:MAG: homoserine dehydrogenase [Erysipelotrichaceae bacterium]
MKIGLLGFGTVGSGVYEIITNSTNKYLNDVSVKTVLVKDEIEKTMDIMTLDINDILNDKEITTVVEVIGGINPAYKFISSALAAKKNVVTANKAVTAAHLAEFEKLAQENGVFFLFEASTGGGIPWIKSIEKAKRIDEINSVNGIYNGTTNFILDNMFKNDHDFDEILGIAQSLGYAEANPAADIDGIDIKNKTMISSSIAYNTITPLDEILMFGIRNVTKNDIAYFKRHAKVLKLMSVSIRKDNEYAAVVEPVLFDHYCLEANVGSNFNLCTLVGETIGDLKFYGQGAGKLPTANAIVQDIIDIATKQCTNYDCTFDNKLSYNPELISGKYVIRMHHETELIPNVSKFVEFNDSYYYLTKEMNIKEMHELAKVLIEAESDVFFARVSKKQG